MRKTLLLLTCLLCFYSCKQANTQIQANIHYKQKVNGYDVSVICYIDRRHNGISYNEENPEAISGRGFIHFKNGEKEFVVENPLFTDCNLFNNEQLLEDGMTIEVDYTPFLAENPLQPFISNKSPFFFYDIDFDGKEELIVCLWEGMGYKGHHAYKAYEIDTESKYLVLSPAQGELYEELNDYAEFDYENKTISIPYGVGVRYEGLKTYGLVSEFDCAQPNSKAKNHLELKEFLKYDWEHTNGVKYEPCAPTIYHYKKKNGAMVLDTVIRCNNDKE